ncbi:MAG TPA: glyoxylate/hydroxypyruvate reductase A [Rhizomicrobium sp.]|nr:glyoxylate/hydroxypyruvate reductase A [Rhizomicrobium sp.]
MSKPKLLMIVPSKWSGQWTNLLDTVQVVIEGRDFYRPEDIAYALSFKPPPGLLKTLPNLKAAFSLGAGVDGFLSDPDYPRHVPLVRFVDRTLTAEMAQYVLLHVLMRHRLQRFFDQAQSQKQWRQMMLPRRTEDTRVGFMGLGEVARFSAERVSELGFPVSSWTAHRKDFAGIRSFAGDSELPAFLGQADILVCLLSLTRKTAGILNTRTFAALPEGAFVINAARGQHLNEKDLVKALDSGWLSGAALDVFEEEPLPATSPLWTHPKVTVTPHVASISQPAVVTRYVLDGIAAFERGEPPKDIVDIDTAY